MRAGIADMAVAPGDRVLALLVPPVLQLPRVRRRRVHPVEVRVRQSRRSSARPASRPSSARSRSAWLCRTYIVRSATRRACSASCASGPGPSARPVRVIASSTAVSTTARVRRAINSARPPRFNGSASTWPAAASSVASAAVIAASTAPRCASVCGSTDSREALAYIGAATARAPPSQHALTPMAPYQKPGRSRYSPGAPTAVAGAPANSTDRVSESAIPALRQLLAAAAHDDRRGRRRTGRDVRSRLARSPTRACRCPRPNTTPWCLPALSRPLHHVHAHRVAGLSGPNTP